MIIIRIAIAIILLALLAKVIALAIFLIEICASIIVVLVVLACIDSMIKSFGNENKISSCNESARNGRTQRT